MNSECEEELGRISDLIDQGKLPETAIPRLVYSGHKLLHAFCTEDNSYKCIACGKEKKYTRMPDYCACGSDDIFDITNCRKARWECLNCKHEWTSEDGTKCPACGDVKES